MVPQRVFIYLFIYLFIISPLSLYICTQKHIKFCSTYWEHLFSFFCLLPSKLGELSNVAVGMMVSGERERNEEDESHGEGGKARGRDGEMGNV